MAQVGQMFTRFSTLQQPSNVRLETGGVRTTGRSRAILRTELLPPMKPEAAISEQRHLHLLGTYLGNRFHNSPTLAMIFEQSAS
jgi:hypothetical protein